MKWFRNAFPADPEEQRIINILRPGNQWGKSLVLAMAHIFHAVTKIQLWTRIPQSVVAWGSTEYNTVNIGKEYEVAKEVYYMILRLVQGELVMPGLGVNESILKDWSIVSAKEKPLPEIEWWNGSKTLFRSYSDMGAAYKMKKFGFVSVDEAGDIPELNMFVSGTLLPRVIFLKGCIWLVGTPQAKQVAVNEYREMIERAKREPKAFYTQEGSAYENPFLPPEFLAQMELVADPEMKRQIVYGEFANIGDKFFTFEELGKLVDKDMTYDADSGESEPCVQNARYLVSVDFASSKYDQFAITVIRWDCFPYKVVRHKAWPGNMIPPPMQYQMVKDWVSDYSQSGSKCYAVYDEGGSGGKTAGTFLTDISPRPFPYPGPGRHYSEVKANSLSALKDLMNENRVAIEIIGIVHDTTDKWGGLKMANIHDFVGEMSSYVLEDSKIRQDRVSTLWMAAYWLSLRRSKSVRKSALAFDYLGYIS